MSCVFFHRVVSSEEGAVYTYVSDKGNDGLILMGIPEYQIPYIEQLARTLDRPGLTDEDNTKRVYRQLKHRRANIDPVHPELDDSAFPTSLLTYLTGNSTRIIVDPTRNALYIEDPASGIANLDTAYATALDVPTPQAILNLKIYELAMENNTRLGLDYISWKNGPGAALFAIGAFKEYGRVDVRHGSGSTVDPLNGINALTLPRSNFSNQGFNFAYRYEVPSAFFDFLTARGKARLLNSVRVAALNTRPAEVTAGDQILYYAVQASNPSGVRARGDLFNLNNPNRDTSASTPGGRTVVGTINQLDETGALTPVSTGLTLNLTPLIYENGLDIQIDGRLTDFNGFDDRGFPRLNSRDLATTIRMNEGEETILGGLVRESQIKGSNKILILGKIPVLGYLFGGENTRHTRSEVIISITAEKIDRFDGKDYAVSQAEQKVLRQAEGREPIHEPKLIYGFDQYGLDKEKAASQPKEQLPETSKE
jgi:type II secretory pathway component GspD/PulD (secretin)